MPIVLNGSTGIVEGNIADNAITANKIATGAVSASDIADNTISAAKLAIGVGGKILQIQEQTQWIQNEVQFSVGSSYSWNTVTITPISNNSRIILFSNPQFYTRSTDGGSNGNTHIFADDITNNVSVKLNEWINYSDNRSTTDGLRLRYPFIQFFNNTVTTQRQFRLRAYANGPNTGRIGGECQVTTMCIEIAN
jgi:hypothetical protein